MNWLQPLSDWIGKRVVATIEDQAGLDPVSAPKSFILANVQLTAEQTHVQFYLNDTQFLSVPIFHDGRTKLSEQEFLSDDNASMLKYAVRLQ